MSSRSTGHWTFSREIYKEEILNNKKEKKPHNPAERETENPKRCNICYYLNFFMPRSHNPEVRGTENPLSARMSGFKSFKRINPLG